MSQELIIIQCSGGEAILLLFIYQHGQESPCLHITKAHTGLLTSGVVHNLSLHPAGCLLYQLTARDTSPLIVRLCSAWRHLSLYVLLNSSHIGDVEL